MQLILVRHGLPHRIAPGSLPAGVVADPGLTDQGRRQAQVTGEFLGAENVDAVYASPVRRAWETGAVIAASLGMTARECAGVAEWDASATSYIPVEERVAADDEMWRALRSGKLPDQDFDGEEFRRLVVDTVGGIADARADATDSRGAVVVVTHAGVINAYVGHLLERRDPFWLPLPMAPGYCSLTRIVMVAGAASAQVVSVNETAHVRDLLSSSVAGTTFTPH
ncbi:MAG: Phosphoglycerate mutase [Solirubrobacterales bacterium]|nr:Phosphoglycerate mutase [Solirubrobacterales bacterium]